MVSAAPLFLISICVFVFYAIFVTIENRRGRRLLFSSLRGWIDAVIVKIYNKLSFWFRYLGRHIIKLSWYYSIHRFLRFILTLLVKSYDGLEKIFLQNHNRAKVIKKEKKLMEKDNHLHQMVDHKANTALSASEKKKLLNKKLEGR